MVNIFMQILDMSITASYVILAVMGVRLLLRKAPKKYAYALWIAPLFRLLCPVSIQSVASAFNFSPMHRAASQTGGELRFIPRDVVIPQSNAEIPPVDTVITPVTPPVDTVISTVPPVMDTAGTAPMPSVTPEASVNPLQVLIFVGMIIWLIGMAVMVTVSVVNYFRLKKGLRFATRMEGNVWQCETVRSPFLVGLIKPKIYLPYGLDEQTEGYILAHERYHLKRFDHIAKLLGYTALTVHWFNPLCHLAFRLMNGDMEMSCDEHVLERNNIPTTQYSYSLLTIATNRRFPAATPLAFAETGVKERMINVLKWKKPKKWVSVVAVMVCVILLISCTTNPKVNDTTADELQVGNPAMLEFPGVKWFVTPDELKEALNITADQILNEATELDRIDTANDYDRYMLTVTDLVLFGRKVTYAFFEFRRDPGYDFEFINARLMLEEDTDMDKLKEDMVEIYGPGAGENYSFYLYSYSDYEKTEHTLKSRMDSQLEYFAKSGAHLKGLEGNPFRDVLDDPEYKTHIWVNENSCDILPEESVEELGTRMRSANQNAAPDDKELTEMLDQMPMIHIAITNRCASTVYRNVMGTVDEMTPYYTYNYVEFNANSLANYRRIAEQKSVTVPSTEEAFLLEFPGLKWGASVEEVKQALNITEEQISSDYLTEGSNHKTHLLHVKDIIFFGEEVSLACFKFQSVDEENVGLSYIMLFLDEDTDMNRFQDVLSYYYRNQGTGEYFDTCKWEIKDEVNFDPDADRRVEYELVEGKSRGGDAELWWLADNPLSGSGYKLYEAARKIIEDPEFKTYNWVSSVKPRVVVKSEGLDALKTIYERNLGIDPSVTDRWLEKRPLVWMSISNRSLQAARAEVEGATDGELALATNNVVYIDAQTLIELQYETQRLQKVLESE